MLLVFYYSGLEVLERRALITTQTAICLSQKKEKILLPKVGLNNQIPEGVLDDIEERFSDLSTNEGTRVASNDMVKLLILIL